MTEYFQKTYFTTLHGYKKITKIKVIKFENEEEFVLLQTNKYWTDLEKKEFEKRKKELNINLNELKLKEYEISLFYWITQAPYWDAEVQYHFSWELNSQEIDLYEKDEINQFIDKNNLIDDEDYFTIEDI